MSVFEHLEEQYLKKGYAVYSKHSSVLPAIPPEWSGPFPDLVAEKGNERVAIFLETSNSLADSLTPSRWRQVIDNDAVLKLYVRDQAEMDLLCQIVQNERVQADVALLVRKGFRPRSVARTRRRVSRLVIALVVISIVCSLVLWLVSYLYDYETDYYEPRDQERETGRNEP